ncbi:hypothetical protein L7F22_027637 [Adiantum nelumboides]|nr:hypothetical protein [Adiantum nelumboides]
MASFTASSICFTFQTAEVSHGKSHVGKASSSCLPSYSEVVTAGFRNSVSKLDVKVCEEAQRRVQCMAQQTVSPLLEFSERADSSFALPTLASSPSTLVESGHYWSSPAEVQPAISGSSLSQGDTFGGVSIASLMEPVAEDLQILNRNLHTVVGSENPLLMAAAEQIFSAGGKRMRPALVLLVSKATAQLAGAKDLSPQHRRLAEVIEMIHTASLIHDDVLDESDVRREMAVNLLVVTMKKWEVKVESSITAGLEFLFSVNLSLDYCILLFKLMMNKRLYSSLMGT